MGRTLGTFLVGKGLVLAATTITVLKSGLPTLVSAIIVAVVSSTIGAIGMILSAKISSKAVREHVNPKLNDIAAKVEADRRVTDTNGQ